jgi:hypothetical protein
MKKGRKQSEQTQTLRADASAGMISPSMSKKSQSKTSLKLESSPESPFVADESGGGPPKKLKKKKKKAIVSSNSKKGSLTQNAHSPEQDEEYSSFVAESGGDPPKKSKKKKKAKAPVRVSSQEQDEEHSASAKDMKKQLMWAEREAKILRSEQRVILAGNRIEKKGMSEALEKLEREREEMVEIIAQLEDEKYGAGNEPYGYREERSFAGDEPSFAENEHYGYGDEPSFARDGPSFARDGPSFAGDEPSFAEDEQDAMASPICFIDVVDSESVDEFTAVSSYHDDEDSSAPAGWLGSEIARRSGHTDELRQRDPDPLRKVRRSRSSERMPSTESTRSEQVGRPRSSERMQSTEMVDPLSLSTRSEQVGRSRSSERMNLQVSRSRSSERMKSTGMDPLSLSARSRESSTDENRRLNIDDYYAKKQRSNSSERKFGSERSEGRSVRRTNSAEKRLLPQSMHGDTKSMRSRTKEEISMCRSDHGNVGRRQKLSRASSERHMPRMEPPQRGFTRINSDERLAREAPSQRMVRRTHSGDNLVKVERYY